MDKGTTDFKMTRKNIKDYTQMQIKKSILKRLEKLKIHPQQSYGEVIEGLLKNTESEDKTK